MKLDRYLSSRAHTISFQKFLSAENMGSLLQIRTFLNRIWPMKTFRSGQRERIFSLTNFLNNFRSIWREKTHFTTKNIAHKFCHNTAILVWWSYLSSLQVNCQIRNRTKRPDPVKSKNVRTKPEDRKNASFDYVVSENLSIFTYDVERALPLYRPL